MTKHPPSDPSHKLMGAIKDLQGLFELLYQHSLKQDQQHQAQLSAIEARLAGLENQPSQIPTQNTTPAPPEVSSQPLINDLCAELEATKASLKTAQEKILELTNQVHQERTKLENRSQPQTPPTKVINGVILPHGRDTSINAHERSAQRTHATQTHQNPPMAKRIQTSTPPPAIPHQIKIQTSMMWQQISRLYHRGHEEALLQLNVLKVGVDETTQRKRRISPELPVILTPNPSSQYHYLVLGNKDAFIAVPKMGLVIQAKLASMIALEDLYEVSGESGRIRSIEEPALLSKQGDHFRILQKGQLTLLG